MVYKNQKVAVIEAKSDELEVGEGVAQAKAYADKLNIQYTYSSNGKEIYEMCMKSGEEGIIDEFPNPDTLWHRLYSDFDKWMKLDLEYVKNKSFVYDFVITIKTIWLLVKLTLKSIIKT